MPDNRAILFVEPHRLDLIAVEPPPLPADGARVRILAAGVCGSDVLVWSGALKPRTQPVILGHEGCGLVLEAGPDSGVRAGQRVAIDPSRPCDQCETCAAGRRHLCPTLQVMGSTLPGTWADAATLHRSQIYPMPESWSDEMGAMVEPTVVAVHVIDQANLQPGQSVVVLGAGIIGLLVVQVARLQGADVIAVTGRQPLKLDLARQFGAVFAVNATTEDAVPALLRETGEVDVVIDCIGTSQALQEAMMLARPGGRVVLVSTPHEPLLAFPFRVMLNKELTLVASRMYGTSYPAGLRLLAERRIQIDPLITHRFPLADAAACLETVHRERARAIKALLIP